MFRKKEIKTIIGCIQNHNNFKLKISEAKIYQQKTVIVCSENSTLVTNDLDSCIRMNISGKIYSCN